MQDILERHGSVQEYSKDRPEAIAKHKQTPSYRTCATAVPGSKAVQADENEIQTVQRKETIDEKHSHVRPCSPFNRFGIGFLFSSSSSSSISVGDEVQTTL